MITCDQAHDLRSCIQQGIDQIGDWREALSQALATADSLVAATAPTKRTTTFKGEVFSAHRERTIYPSMRELRQTLKMHFNYREGSGGIMIRFAGHKPHRVIAVTSLEIKDGKIGRDGFEAAVQRYVSGLTDLHLSQHYLAVLTRDLQPSDLAQSVRSGA